MKFKLDVTPDLVAAMAAEIAAGEKAATSAVRQAGTRPRRRALRADVS